MSELLTVAAAAARFGHSVSWLRRKIRKRQIDVYRPLGGHPRLRAEDVEKAIAGSRVEPPVRGRRTTRGASVSVERLKDIAAEAQ